MAKRKKRTAVVNETFVYGIKYYAIPKRCPDCGTKNHKRDENGVCQKCNMQRKKV